MATITPITKFGPQSPAPGSKPLPQFYECGICGQMHPAVWDGDCRDDNNRFSIMQVEERYGRLDEGWEEVPMPGSDE